MRTLKDLFAAVFRPVVFASQQRTLLRGFISREIKGRYAGTMAGVSWTLVNPLTTLLIYMFLFSIVLRVQVTAEETGTDSFFIYFATGFVPWIMFSEGINRATNCLLENAGLITKVIFPVELLPVTAVLSGMLINILGLGLLMAYLGWHGFGDPSWVWVVALLPVQFLFTLGLGLLFSAVSVYLRDVTEFINILLMVWFFATPIIYPLSLVPNFFTSLIQLNPMYMFVTLYRNILIRHHVDALLFIQAFLVSLLVYSLGSLFFAKVKPGFGDVL